MGRGQTLNALRKHFASQMTLDRYAEDASLFPQTPNLYEIEEPIVNTNRLWTRLNKYNLILMHHLYFCTVIIFYTSYFRGIITVTEDGRRHVSLGRGYVLHEFPEQNPKVEECIVHVLEKRQKVCHNCGYGMQMIYTKLCKTINLKNYFCRYYDTIHYLLS